MKFTKKHVINNSNFKTKSEMFKYIADISFSEKIIKSKADLVAGFEKRESEGTTGFEDGFAIPHARVDTVVEPSLFVIKNKDKISDWEALDSNGVKYAIALLIPSSSGSFHMDILSKIAGKLMDPLFRDVIKKDGVDSIYKEFNLIINDVLKMNNNPSNIDEKVDVEKTKSNKDLLIGISACPAGIAHTFMVKQKMELAAKELNMDIKWETQGSNGQKNKLSHEEISRAKVIIIASDIELDLARFHGKKIFITSTNDAIKNGKELVLRAENKSKKFSGDIHHQKSGISKFGNILLKSFKSSFGKPWFYFSVTATLLAMTSLIGFSIYGEAWRTEAYERNINLFKLQSIASIALFLSMPIMAGSVAKKMTKKSEAFFIVFLATLLLNIPFMRPVLNSVNGYDYNNSKDAYDILFYDWNGFFKTGQVSRGSNIIGALVTTIMTYFVFLMIMKFKSFLKNRKCKFSKVVRMSLSPWVTTSLPAAFALFVIVFLFGMPLAYASSKVVYGLVEYANDYWWLRFIIGAAFGIGISWDLGGSTNKITLITLIGLAQYDLRLGSLIAIGIPLASIGLGTTYFFHKDNFKKDDSEEASKSFVKGLEGMSEGPLFLTNKYGLRVHMTNVIATAFATGIAYVLGFYILKAGGLGILFLGGQAHLASANDITWLNTLLPLDLGVGTFFISILYGIIGYYLVMFIGSMMYLGISNITFRINLMGKKVFK